MEKKNTYKIDKSV